MTESRHDEWLELILGYEELSPEERTRANSHLATCEHCRTILARLQAAERDAALPGALPPLEDQAAYQLSASAALQAQASLAGLRERLGLPSQAPSHSSERPAQTSAASQPVPRDASARRGLLAWLLVPAAAAVGVILLLLPGPGEQGAETTGVEVRRLIIHETSSPRGGESPAQRDSSAEVAPGAAWRTGQGFVILISLQEEGYPLIVHIDPVGRATLLYPEHVAQPLTRFPALDSIVLPDYLSDVEWTFEAETGLETFLVAATRRERDFPRDLPTVLDELNRTTPDREAMVARVRALLTDRVGPVDSLIILHTPDGGR